MVGREQGTVGQAKLTLCYPASLMVGTWSLFLAVIGYVKKKKEETLTLRGDKIKNKEGSYWMRKTGERKKRRNTSQKLEEKLKKKIKVGRMKETQRRQIMYSESK